MSYEQPNDDSLTPVEQALASFSPQSLRLDRDRLMFLAGQASAAGLPVSNVQKQSSRAWPLSTAALAVCAAALGVALVIRPAPEEKIIYRDRFVTRPAESQPIAPVTPLDSPDLPTVAADSIEARSFSVLPRNNYLRSRDVAFRLGLDALGSQTSAGSATAPAPTSRDWLTVAVEGTAAEGAHPAPRSDL